MDHVIYRDYVVNRHFFIYCSLATVWAASLMASNISFTETPYLLWRMIQEGNLIIFLGLECFLSAGFFWTTSALM